MCFFLASLEEDGDEGTARASPRMTRTEDRIFSYYTKLKQGVFSAKCMKKASLCPLQAATLTRFPHLFPPSPPPKKPPPTRAKCLPRDAQLGEEEEVPKKNVCRRRCSARDLKK